jgi:hypothetical protein
MENFNEEFEMDLLNVFLNTDLNYRSYLGLPKDYMTSELKKEKYKNLTREDNNFEDYIKLKYGSLENFYKFNVKITAFYYLRKIIFFYQ